MVRNNLAATSMLLKIGLVEAHEMARELHQENPADMFVAATYAYSLHLHKRTQEALALMDRMDPAALRDPAGALYFGFVATAAGRTDAARQFLDDAQAVDLLPEESKMALKLRGQLNDPAPKPN